MSFFDLNKITFPPEKEKDINTWADYCELYCILSEDGLQTIDRLCDRLIEDSDNDVEKAAQRLALTASGRGSRFADILTPDAPDDDAEVNEDGRSAAPEGIDSDRLHGEFLFLFSFLQARAKVFGDSYPFDVGGTDIRLKIETVPRQRLYLGILLASLLRIYTPAKRNELGHIFEELCGPVFGRMVPANSIIHPFGSGGGAPNAGREFTGKFYDKVCRLGELIHTPPATLFLNTAADHQHTGDGGLDWVGWLPFADGCSKMPLFFGQCASGADWMDKEFDAHDDKWRNNLQFHDQFLLYHFITKAFRDPGGDWYRPSEINYGIVLIDRLRFLMLLSDEEVAKANASYAALVGEALAFKMPTIDI